MKALDFNRGWQFATEPYNMMQNIIAEMMHTEKSARTVNLPHDSMIESDTRADAPAGPASGYYTAGVSHYTKKVEIPAAWQGEEVYLAFDGAMMNATLEVNDNRAALQHNGYIPFAVRITPYLYFGEENRLTVTVNPSMQPNSRWYTGAGIIRSVSLIHCPKLHIARDGIFGYTRALDYRADGTTELAHLETVVDVSNETTETRLAEVTVWLTEENGEETVAQCSQMLQVNPGETAAAYLRFVLENPRLWNAEHPNLYRMHARVTETATFRTRACPAENPMQDEDSVLFGVRTVQVDSTRGLRINGQSVKLKGGCLHHDNGIVGAISLYDLEHRKLEKLKAIGFNAVRTTHNPPSAALIEACDRLGIYVLDEAFDAWGMGKQPGDYNQYFDTDWQKDLRAFVRRDRPHPAVILWSTGNEIVERGGLGNGYSLASQLAEAVHALDPSRPVTNAICSYWNGLDEKRMRTAMKKMVAASMASSQNAKMEGKEDTDWEEFSAPFTNGLDVVGYNYMEDKYEKDHALYPQRVILGTENYPKEVGLHWPMIEKLPYVLGEFTWTACDYIGEAGIGKGVFVESEVATNTHPDQLVNGTPSAYPWRTAYDADLDILGGQMPQGDYRSVVWGSQACYLYSYDPAVFEKTEVLSRWGFPDVRHCWTWPGSEGKMTRVVVFSGAEEVVLFLNGTEASRKKAGENLLMDLPHSFVFTLPYTPGRLEAVSYAGGQKIGETALETTGPATALRLRTERTQLPADGHSVACVWAELVDEQGRVVPYEEVLLQLQLSGPAALAGFGSAIPITADNYSVGECHTYQGRAMLVLRSGYEIGSVTVKVSAKETPHLSATATVECKANN